MVCHVSTSLVVTWSQRCLQRGGEGVGVEKKSPRWEGQNSNDTSIMIID